LVISENLKSLEQKKLYWYERSHETWLLKSDTNTSYFHKCANGRKRKNNIISLESEGQMIEGDENILKHATDYYTNLFGPPIDSDVQMDPNIWASIPRVSVSENDDLCKPFSEQEIKNALDARQNSN
jgi:hypothetical protein